MKLDELLYVFVLVALALLFGANDGCGGAVVDAPPLDDDAGDVAPDAGCVCLTCIYPTPEPCDASNAGPKP